jgi:hypothetical protein
VSRIERGQLAGLHLGAIRRVATVLEIQLLFQQRWRGGELARLLDEEHAALVERLTRDLAAAGWQVQPEYTFNHFGERGAVDIVGWHAPKRALALVEVKTRIVDVQDLLSSTARKQRIVPRLLQQERGWTPDTVGELLVVLDTSSNRRTIAAHRATFEAAFHARTSAVRGWIRAPDVNLAGLAFVAALASRSRSRRTGGPSRVRRKD